MSESSRPLKTPDDRVERTVGVVDSNFDWRGEEGSGAWLNSYPEVADFTLPQAPGGSGG